MKIEIMYEDKAILIIRKPAGLAVQTARLGQADCVSELKNYLHQCTPGKGEPYLGVVHRLDQPVEGVLVFAKSKTSAAALSVQLKEGMMNKKYYAVVCLPILQTQLLQEAPSCDGQQQDWIILKDYVKKDGKTGSASVCSKIPEAKYAKLRYRRLSGKSRLAKLEIELETGRFHQIRVQMSHQGMPLLGDYKYGTEESKLLSKQQGISNVALCAYCLEFKHPVTGRWEVWECKPQNPAFQLTER